MLLNRFSTDQLATFSYMATFRQGYQHLYSAANKLRESTLPAQEVIRGMSRGERKALMRNVGRPRWGEPKTGFIEAVELDIDNLDEAKKAYGFSNKNIPLDSNPNLYDSGNNRFNNRRHRETYYRRLDRDDNSRRIKAENNRKTLVTLPDGSVTYNPQLMMNYERFNDTFKADVLRPSPNPKDQGRKYKAYQDFPNKFNIYREAKLDSNWRQGIKSGRIPLTDPNPIIQVEYKSGNDIAEVLNDKGYDLSTPGLGMEYRNDPSYLSLTPDQRKQFDTVMRRNAGTGSYDLRTTPNHRNLVYNTGFGEAIPDMRSTPNNHESLPRIPALDVPIYPEMIQTSKPVTMQELTPDWNGRIIDQGDTGQVKPIQLNPNYTPSNRKAYKRLQQYKNEKGNTLGNRMRDNLSTEDIYENQVYGY